MASMCRMGSWTYSADMVDFLSLGISSGFVEMENDGAYCPNAVQSYNARRNVHYYECCPDQPFVDITIDLQLAWSQSR